MCDLLSLPFFFFLNWERVFMVFVIVIVVLSPGGIFVTRSQVGLELWTLTSPPPACLSGDVCVNADISQPQP